MTKKLHSFFAIVLSAFVLLAVAIPANAARVYNPDTNRWEEATARATSTRQSSVPRRLVDYTTNLKVGSIVVETSERRAYFVMPDGKAMRYGVGVGRDGFRWSGTHRLTRKAEWPGWTPPAAMRRRQPELPAYMPGGPDNPLGARALYVGSTLYRLHGTSEPWTIGQAVSSGCIRLTNDDITDLYERVRVGALIVVNQ
ncbi:MAG: L,D-transpeptidase [Devosiaceae bacterium]|nr:L,D-transpeptidase [Devosiaceae bacterium]